MEEFAYLYTDNGWLVNAYGKKDDNGFPIFDYVETVNTPEALKEMGWESE